MIEVLKIIHFLALAVGVGGGVANAVIGARAASVDPQIKPILGGISGIIGKLSGAALILLWITGIALVYLVFHGWSELPVAFWIKLVFVVVLSLISLRMNLYVMNTTRTKTPPPAATMKRLGQVASLSSLLIIVFAVIAFTA